MRRRSWRKSVRLVTAIRARRVTCRWWGISRKTVWPTVATEFATQLPGMRWQKAAPGGTANRGKADLSTQPGLRWDGISAFLNRRLSVLVIGAKVVAVRASGLWRARAAADLSPGERERNMPPLA